MSITLDEFINSEFTLGTDKVTFIKGAKETEDLIKKYDLDIDFDDTEKPVGALIAGEDTIVIFYHSSKVLYHIPDKSKPENKVMDSSETYGYMGLGFILKEDEWFNTINFSWARSYDPDPKTLQFFEENFKLPATSK